MLESAVPATAPPPRNLAHVERPGALQAPPPPRPAGHGPGEGSTSSASDAMLAYSQVGGSTNAVYQRPTSGQYQRPTSG
eukprot:2023888-Rhodomonas_salina.1